MGCCMTRDNKNPFQPNTVSKPEHVFYNNKEFKFKSINDIEDLNETPTLNRSNYGKMNFGPVSFQEEVNLTDIAPLKLKREDMFEIIIIISSFDLWCNPGNYFSNFFCDFYPELLLTFEDKIENFAYEKNLEVEVDEDYLNRSGQFESGLVGTNKRRSNSTSNNVASSANNNEKKVKQFLFESNIFKIPEILYERIFNSDKNSLINFALVQKNRRDESNRFVIGEGFFPVHFLYTSFKEQDENDKIEIPIFNHIEDLFIGNLNIRAQTNFIPAEPKSDYKDKLKTLNGRKVQKSNALRNFLKFQIMSLRDYGKIHRTPFCNESDIESYDENLNKIDIHNIIQKYIVEKDEALRELYHYFYDYVDTSINTSMNTDLETVNIKANLNTNMNSEKKKFRLDFKTLNQVKYFFFISILNDCLIKSDNDQNFIVIKNSKFLNEKIIFSPYETSRNDNKNYLLAEKVISLLLNIRKNSSSPFDPRFRIDYLLAYFGNYYKKSADHVLTFLEKSGIRMTGNNNDSTMKNFGPVSNESYLIFRNILYKFLKIIRLSIDIKNENLDSSSNKKENSKYNELVDVACQDVEALKRNHFYFLCIKDVFMTKKDKKMIEKDLLYIKDINYVLGIMNILNSYIKLAKNLAKNHLKILPVEFYLSQLLSENSDFINFISVTLNIFYKNQKYLFLLLEIMYELFADAYGIFIFNFFKKVDINTLFKSFSIDVKYLDSRKFPAWNYLFIIISKSLKLIKKPELDSLDFLNLKWKSIFNQIISLNLVLHRNHYFKIADEIDLEFDSKSNMIFMKNSKTKFLINKLALKIQHKFFEMINDFTYKEELIRDLIGRNNKTFIKILSRMVYLVLLKIEGNLVEVVKQNTESFFKTYLNILYILENLKEKFKIDIKKDINTSISIIFASTSEKVLGSFSYDKFMDILSNKIKGMAPSKFDFKLVTTSIETLKIN